MNGRAPPLVYRPAPCPSCGARTEAEANTLCRSNTDETGERYCIGEFRNGISVRPTRASLARLDRWCDAHADDTP